MKEIHMTLIIQRSEELLRHHLLISLQERREKGVGIMNHILLLDMVLQDQGESLHQGLQAQPIVEGWLHLLQPTSIMVLQVLVLLPATDSGEVKTGQTLG